MRILVNQKYLLIILLMSFITCNTKSHSDKSPDDRIRDSLSISVPGAKIFYEKVSEFNSMLMVLQKDSIINKRNVSTIFKPDDFNADLKNKMIKLGITQFDYYWHRCYLKGDTPYAPYQFDFKTNWNDKVAWHLNFVPCPVPESKLSGYTKRDNGNEAWGLGNGWILWYENYLLNDDSILPRYNKIRN